MVFPFFKDYLFTLYLERATASVGPLTTEKELIRTDPMIDQPKLLNGSQSFVYRLRFVEVPLYQVNTFLMVLCILCAIDNLTTQETFHK